MNRPAQAIVMFVLGGAVLRAGLTDLYLRYVRAGFRPFLLAAGVLLMVIAVTTLWYELRPARTPRPDAEASSSSEDSSADGHEDGHDHDEDRHADDGHGHGHRDPRIAWLLVLPLLALIVVVPPALGSYAADRAGTGLQRPVALTDLPAGDPLTIGVLDYASHAVYDDGRTLGGRRMTMTGFITAGQGGTPYLNRMVLNCCAADALPIKVALSGQVAPGLRPDTWVEVTGTFSRKQLKDEVNGGAIPFLDVTSMRRVAAPSEEYES